MSDLSVEQILQAVKNFITLEELAPAEHEFERVKRAQLRFKINELLDEAIVRARMRKL